LNDNNIEIKDNALQKIHCAHSLHYEIE